VQSDCRLIIIDLLLKSLALFYGRTLRVISTTRHQLTRANAIVKQYKRVPKQIIEHGNQINFLTAHRVKLLDKRPTVGNFTPTN